MARRRFFVSGIRNGETEIAGEEAQHLTRVLRVETGQRYEISDDRGVYLAEITSARKQLVAFRILETLPHHPPPVRLHLHAALIKFDHFEWIVEKATELGVEKLVPFAAQRSERGLERAAPKRLERWHRIAVEASQQSRRDHLPEIAAPQTLREILDAPATVRIVCDEEPAGQRTLLEVLPREKNSRDIVAILIGPEGGWTGPEREQFTAAEWTPATLGPQVLRAETAAIAALSIVSAAWQVRT
jgi:16S rRNA (uracil1498-N3)-methyltransferase